MAALAMLLIAPAAAQTTEVVLHNFGYLPRGANPLAGVIRDSAGNLYGTASAGGPANAGVVFKVDTTGHQTVLYGFTGGADGAYPDAGVIRDSAGNLYGTTSDGGVAGVGVVYKLDTASHETVLYSFTGGADGAYPDAGVIRDSAGNLFGTTTSGGPGGAGVVYKVDATGHETVLYSFTGGADGANPYAGVIGDSAGNLYGTTAYGGPAGAGVVYKVDATGHETVLYSFTGGADGANPFAGVIRDPTGNLYGTTYSGGELSSCFGSGCGVVFQVGSSGHETVLHTFTGGADGANPHAGMIRDPTGNLYGTTYSGGDLSSCAGAGCGVVFQLGLSGSHETVLHSFTGGADGGNPVDGVIRDSAGNLFGTTFAGGTLGVVFKVDATGGETVLFGFPDGPGGALPYAGVIRDPAGNLYGTASGGGPVGGGVVYKVDAAGHETTLYNFTRRTDGLSPHAGVVIDSVGNLYGATALGGDLSACLGLGCGVVFKLDTSGHETVLYSFTGGADGSDPNGVIRDSAGNLYGTTVSGGDLNSCFGSGCGVVFKLDTSGHETVLYVFTGGADGSVPYAGVIRDSAGNLYGTTFYGGQGVGQGSGVVYKVDTSGHETVLYSFTGGADGANPVAGVMRDSVGNLYGTTLGGGAAGHGAVYKVDPSGHETVLYSFTGGADGDSPGAGVVSDSASNLYGTTEQGGIVNSFCPLGCGVVFKLDPSGRETVLHSFTGVSDGSLPIPGVIRDAAGNLYGATTAGGKYYGGVLYVLH